MAEDTRLEKVRGAVLRRITRPIYQLVHATTGRRMQVATHFRALTAFGGDFDASSEAARRVLARDVFDMIETSPGRTAVRILALDYQRIDLLAPYRELAISLPVRYRDAKDGEPEGTFVIHMPVTTEEARWGGVELYGFPKIVGDVQLTRDGDEHVAKVTAARQHVLTLRVDDRPTSHGRERLHNFNVRGDHHIIESTFELEGELGRSDGGATIELGDHPIAHELRRLELDTRAKASAYIAHASAVLSKGRILGHVPHPEEGAVRARIAPELA